MDMSLLVLSDPQFSDRYELGDKLGEGGMGTVYRGVQKALGRPVAIKFMSSELGRDPVFIARFAGEAKLAASLVHSHVVAVFDHGVAAGIPYLVTEYVDGQTLSATLSERGALSAPEVIAVTRQLLDALEAVHRVGIIHRDLKPSNILLAPGEPYVAKVLDFGIAKRSTPAPGDGPRTATGAVMGTPDYMSPEQCLGDKLTPSSDLYSFSLIFYQMVTGLPLFSAGSSMEMLQMHIHEAPPIDAAMRPEVRQFLERALAKKAQDRFPTVREYRAAFDAAMKPVEATGSFNALGGMDSASFAKDTPTGKALPAPLPPTALTPRPQAPGWSVLAVPAVILLALGLLWSRTGRTVVLPTLEPFNRDHDLEVSDLWLPESDLTKENFDNLLRRFGESSMGVKRVTKMDDSSELKLALEESATGMYWETAVARAKRTPQGMKVDEKEQEWVIAVHRLQLESVGTMQVGYHGAKNAGGLNLLLARSGRQGPTFLYRLLLDFKTSTAITMVTGPTGHKRTPLDPKFNMRNWASYAWAPDVWKVVGEREFSGLVPTAIVKFGVSKDALTVQVRKESQTYALPAEYQPGHGYLTPFVITQENASLHVNDVRLTGQFYTH